MKCPKCDKEIKASTTKTKGRIKHKCKCGFVRLVDGGKK